MECVGVCCVRFIFFPHSKTKTKTYTTKTFLFFLFGWAEGDGDGCVAVVGGIYVYILLSTRSTLLVSWVYIRVRGGKIHRVGEGRIDGNTYHYFTT